MIVYHVYHSEPWVGEFLQAAFSTNGKAETYILKRGEAGEDVGEFYVVPYTLDSE